MTKPRPTYQSTPKTRTAAARAFSLAETNLDSFAKLVYPKFEIPKHLRLLVDKLEQVERGEIRRLVVAMPPRHGKSMTTSWIFPSWWLGRNPTQSIIAVSYASELAESFGRRVRNTLADPRYRRVFPGAALAGDSTAAHRFNLHEGGAYYAVGVNGVLTGRGSNLLLFDDLTKNALEANSQAHRRSLQSWFESTLFSRLEPDAAIVLISSRWHQDDLAGWLLREHADQGWETLTLAARAEPNDPLGRREGAALWPARYPVSTLEKIRRQVGSNAWLSEYQQRPTAGSGGYFKREWWGSYGPDEQPNRYDEVLISLDTAAKDGSENDYSVGLVIGVYQRKFYILDMLRGKWEFPELVRRLIALAKEWRPINRCLIEDTSSGVALNQSLRGALPIFPVKPVGNKLGRAIPCTADVERGAVLLPKTARWLNDFLEELSGFDKNPHDDIVDSLTQFLNYWREIGGSYDLWQGVFGNAFGSRVDYHAILREAGNHYGLSAMKLSELWKRPVTPAEFQAVIEDQSTTDGSEDLAEVYADRMNRLAGGNGFAYTAARVGSPLQSGMVSAAQVRRFGN